MADRQFSPEALDAASQQLIDAVGALLCIAPNERERAAAFFVGTQCGVADGVLGIVRALEESVPRHDRKPVRGKFHLRPETLHLTMAADFRRSLRPPLRLVHSRGGDLHGH